MRKLIFMMRANVVAGIFVLISALFAASWAQADGLIATVVFDPTTIAGAAEASVTITITNDSGEDMQGTLETSHLPSLPDGLEFTDGPNQGTCSEAAGMSPGNSCEMTAKVRGTAKGNYFWSGIGSTGIYDVNLWTQQPLTVGGTPAYIQVISGDGQSTLKGTDFAEPLVVQVTDVDGEALENIDVSFGLEDQTAAELSATTATTDASGQASITVKAGSEPNFYTVTATVAGLTEPAQFYLTNLPPPSAIEGTVSYSSELIAPGDTADVTIILKNTIGRTINVMLFAEQLPHLPAGLSYVGSVNMEGCGGLQPIAVMSICYITAKVASSTPGTHKWTGAGTTDTRLNAYIQLSDTNGLGVYGDPTSITLETGDAQSVAVGTDFAPLEVKVTDANGLPVPNVSVSFKGPASGAGIAESDATATSNSSGIASGSVSANGIVGAYEVEASVTGIDTAVTFDLANLAGAAASVAVQSGDAQSATVGTAFASPFTVKVTDSYGNPLSGVTVTFTPPATGAGGAFGSDPETAVTDAQGVATSGTFTANGTAGSYSVSASVSGAAPASISAENLPADVDPPALPVVAALSPNHGPAAGGTSVTITGDNLAGATAVTFGGISASFQVVDNSLFVFSPAGTGTVDVLVTTQDGTSAAGTESRFTYDVAPGPDRAEEAAKLDAVQQSLSPVVAGQSSRAISSSIMDAVSLGLTGGTQTRFSPTDMFLAYGPARETAPGPFDEVLTSGSGTLSDNVSVWLDTKGQGILPLSATPERGWQVNLTGGVGLRVTPDILVGTLAGQEQFSYHSEDTDTTLSGRGTSLGAYAGWDLGGVLASLGLVNSVLDYTAETGSASGGFQASRWLLMGKVSGQYELGAFSVEPSAALLAVWEAQEGYTDTLGGEHEARDFGSASASAGLRIARAMPINADWELSPFGGIFVEADADSEDGATSADMSGRLSAGAALTSSGGLAIGINGDLGGLGTDTITLSVGGNARANF